MHGCRLLEVSAERTRLSDHLHWLLAAFLLKTCINKSLWNNLRIFFGNKMMRKTYITSTTCKMSTYRGIFGVVCNKNLESNIKLYIMIFVIKLQLMLRIMKKKRIILVRKIKKNFLFFCTLCNLCDSKENDIYHDCSGKCQDKGACSVWECVRFSNWKKYNALIGLWK